MMFVLLGLCIHIVFLFSIFDIYFKSPIVQGIASYKPQHEAVSDRLVLFIIDGLRAESFVNHTTMPNLRSIARHKGRWGISRSRVPTESRPGHVAVIAGFYEDPSAVAKGWKENPVDFDSVFNQSKHTWCWGAYDIINIFTKSTIDNHIYANKFDPYDQSFSTDKNTTLLDSWVFQNIKAMFENANTDRSLKEKLQEKKIIFFLHLLGTDTAGHTHKPNSVNYLINLKHVDEGVQEIQELINNFYNNDNKTTFLMTSDHGMTDWGSHGAGDDHETMTPYVLWGSGVRIPSSHNAEQGTELPLERRFDIKQADLAPLMSTILSIPVPVNSIGRVPLQLLDMSLEDEAKAISSNSRQLASQYDKKRSDVAANAISMLYQPYGPFNENKFQELLKLLDNFLLQQQYETVIQLSNKIINLSLSGLTYYHEYYQRPLQILITLSFLGWIMYLMNILLKQKINTQFNYSNMNHYSFKSNINMKKSIHILAFGVGFVLCYLIYAHSLPVQYYIYALLPLYLWWKVISSLETWKEMSNMFKRQGSYSLLIEIISYMLGSLAMGLSFTHRWMLSLPLLGMALWPLFTSDRNHLGIPALFIWTGSCIMLSIFSFMPVIGKEVHIELVVAAGLVWTSLHTFYVLTVVKSLCDKRKESQYVLLYNIIQLVLLLLALHNVYAQAKRFEHGAPVSSLHQSIAWTIAVFSLVLPLAASQRILFRLASINISMLTFYLLLSVSHEGFFLITLIINVASWVYIEFKLTHSTQTKVVDLTFSSDHIDEGFNKIDKSVTTQERELSRQDFRRAFFFLLYIILAFFGTGNIASLNSFEVRWVTCFITSFQPFVITTLILLKTMTPFLCVACSFCAVQKITQAPTGYLNIIVLIFSNIMGIQLLYHVKNTGSWLEIGTSISQFVIVQVITLFIVIIHYVAKLLTQINVYTFVNSVFKTRKKYV